MQHHGCYPSLSRCESSSLYLEHKDRGSILLNCKLVQSLRVWTQWQIFFVAASTTGTVDFWCRQTFRLDFVTACCRITKERMLVCAQFAQIAWCVCWIPASQRWRSVLFPGTIRCDCGGNPTNHHISWVCPLFQELREPALAALANPIETYPMCFQYTTLVPNNVFIEQCNLHQIQTSLVNIWQKHIQNWHNAQDQKSVEPTPAANSSTIPQAAEASSNGT